MHVDISFKEDILTIANNAGTWPKIEELKESQIALSTFSL